MRNAEELSKKYDAYSQWAGMVKVSGQCDHMHTIPVANFFIGLGSLDPFHHTQHGG